MKRIWIAVLVVVLLAGLGIAAWLTLRANPELWQRALVETGFASADAQGVTAAGFVEAEEIAIASQRGGRIVEILAAEGDSVTAGDLLVRLDGALLGAQIDAGEAAVAVAEAELAMAQAGARPEQVAQAEAGVEQAQIAERGAYQAWQDAIALRENPQDLDVQIAQARARVAVAEAAVRRAEALKDAAEIANENFFDAREAIEEAREQWAALPEGQRPPKPSLQVGIDFHLLPNQYWQAWVALNTAKAELDAAQIALNDLYRMRQNPQELDAAVDAAEARYASAQAVTSKARAQLDLLQAGATREQIAVLNTQIGQAQAAVDTLLSEQEKLTLTAPVGGVILETALREGELTAPGTPILILGNLDQVKLTLYIPVNQLGQVQIGQPVDVTADSAPDHIFTGEVVAIASEAEFTPRNIQSPEERVHMVFAVDIAIPNPNHILKPGIYADGAIRTEVQP